MSAQVQTVGSLFQQAAMPGWMNSPGLPNAEECNVLLWPPPPGVPAILEGPHTATDGKLETEPNGPVRMCAFLGPDATPRGLGQVVGAMVNSRGTPLPPIDEDAITKAILVYNDSGGPSPMLTKTDWRVGRRLILPIEQQAGKWVTEGAWYSTLASQYTGPLALSTITPASDLAPGRNPDAAVLLSLPFELDTRATDELAGAGAKWGARFGSLTKTPDPQTLAAHLRLRLLANPFAEVFLFIEILRQLRRDASAQLVPFVEALLVAPVTPPSGPSMSAQQLQLIAWSTAGNAILRALWMAGPGTAAKNLLGQALGLQGASNAYIDFSGATGRAPSLAPTELPLTDRQKRPVAPPSRGKKSHSSPQFTIVFGRIVSLGVVGGLPYQARQAPKKLVEHFHGFGTLGALTVRAVLDNLEKNPRLKALGGAFGDAATHELLKPAINTVQEIAGNEAMIDGTNCYDVGLISAGIQQWTMQANNELAVLLYRYGRVAADHYDLFFGMRNLYLDQRVDQKGKLGDRYASPPVTLGTLVDKQDDRRPPVSVTVYEMTQAGPVEKHEYNPVKGTDPDRAALFDVKRDAKDPTQFKSEGAWAARSRLAAWFSLEYRILQLQVAVFRFRRMLNPQSDPPGKVDWPLTQIPVGTAGKKVSIADVVTSQLGAAALLDQHINAPFALRGDLKKALDARAALYTGAPIDAHAQTIAMLSYLDQRTLNSKAKRDYALLRNSNLDIEADTFKSSKDSGWLP